MERDALAVFGYIFTMDFNSHAHVERDGSRTLTSTPSRDFNSHAHVERDAVIEAVAENIGISTHTLTWSVTMGKCE